MAQGPLTEDHIGRLAQHILGVERWAFAYDCFHDIEHFRVWKYGKGFTYTVSVNDFHYWTATIDRVVKGLVLPLGWAFYSATMKEALGAWS